MDYEKLHKDTITRLHQMVNSGKITVETACSICADFVPESEDERIRKDMIETIKKEAHDFPSSVIAEKSNSWITWLEKQGEHAKFRDSIQVGDKVTRNQDGMLVNLSQLNRVAKKQGEQKPAWSEEDEKCIRLSTDIIDSALRAGFCVQLDRDRCVDWLKSLRPQNWKPSDEQMEALKYSTYCPNEQMSKVLFELYQDLDKLKA